MCFFLRLLRKSNTKQSRMVFDITTILIIKTNTLLNITAYNKIN